MIKIIYIILFLFSSLFAKDIIAILELEPIGLTLDESKILTHRLTSKIVSIDKYQVVERSNMDKILKEQEFQYSSCTDSECAVEIGQLLNTDLVVIGNVSKFDSIFSLDAKLIEVSRGMILKSAEFSNEGDMSILLTKGIESVAQQLSEFHVKKEIEDVNDALVLDSDTNKVSFKLTEF